jgi:hypothetical protein
MTLHQPIAITPQTGDPTIYSSEQEFRNMLLSLLPAPQLASTPEGVWGPAAFHIGGHAGGSNFSVDVAPGMAWITDDDITSGGAYWVWSDAVYNLATPSAPATGTRTHRVVLQLRNKSENGAWSTYDFIPVLVPDIGGGLPAEPASAITLGTVSIAAGQVSVTNGNCADYRQRVDPVAVYKPGTTTITSSVTIADDPDLQLLCLQPNAQYKITGNIVYNGGAPGSGAEGDLQFTWRGGASSVFIYNAGRLNLATAEVGSYTNGLSDVVNCQTQGTGTRLGARILGELATGAAPAYLVFRWAQNSPQATGTSVIPGSFLEAVQIA